MNAFNADMDQRRGRQQLKRGLLAVKEQHAVTGPVRASRAAANPDLSGDQQGWEGISRVEVDHQN
ncbi:hypothetical protein CKAH01_09685 [Colletotrichum kahawae]|uniref:Uncharacterized protein n=1 Tax=Colletotrichum kahawae TaxID=34407 RepID=A0AAD9XZA5_COLKA|nr:hypothetical protein CKAH01_09685 [Colletotrichum kahawae]